MVVGGNFSRSRRTQATGPANAQVHVGWRETLSARPGQRNHSVNGGAKPTQSRRANFHLNKTVTTQERLSNNVK
jgi:hypothetical protein